MGSEATVRSLINSQDVLCPQVGGSRIKVIGHLLKQGAS